MRQLVAAVLFVTSMLPGQDDPVLGRLRAAAAEAPLVVAHRGSSYDHPENTLAAFRAAVAAKAQVVEFDVYQTVDGQWVCLHDATCDRTTDAVARLGRKEVHVDALTLAEVREFDAGSWFAPKFAGERIPTLAEALETILPGAVPMIERKGGDPGALVEELRRLDAVERVIVQAFDWDWLEAVHAAEPGLLIAALGGKELAAAQLDGLLRTGAAIVHWNHGTVTVEAATAVRTKGHLLCVYTVDPDVTLLGAAAIGCDLITTNRPARMAELRRRGLLRRPVRTR